MLTRRPLLLSPWWLGAALAPAQAQDLSLEGDWRAPMRHAGETAWLGLRILRVKGELQAQVSAPVVHVNQVGIGPVRLRGAHLQIGDDWLLQRSLDGQRLLGVTPDSLVPRLKLPLVFERGALARPARALPPAPAPRLAWRRELGAPLWADLVHDGAQLYAGDDAGRLHALALADGRSRWTASLGGALRARPLLHRGLLLLQADDGRLHALDAASGASRWQLALQAEPVKRLAADQPGSRFDRFGAAAVPVGDALLTASHAGELVCWDWAARTPRWRVALPAPLLGTPALAQGRVVIGAFDGSVRALDLADGRELWRFDTGEPVVSAPWIEQGRVFVGSRSYELFALDLLTGKEAWRRYHWFSWVESAVAGFGGALFVGSSDGAHLSSLNPANGALHWRRDVFGWAWGQPAVDARQVAIGTAALGGYGVKHGAAVWSFERRSGALRWRFPLQAPQQEQSYGVTGSLALAGERVFAATLDGEVLALAA